MYIYVVFVKIIQFKILIFFCRYKKCISYILLASIYSGYYWTLYVVII